MLPDAGRQPAWPVSVALIWFAGRALTGAHARSRQNPARLPFMSKSLDRLRDIMTRLRHPRDGCPWDVEQTFETIAPYTIEEAYEVADAIARADFDDLRDELGDLLLQVVFHAEMAREAGHFDFDDVAATIADKMVRRHPHVFGADDVAGVAHQRRVWEDQKAHERQEKSHRRGEASSALDGVPVALPALLRAEKLSKRAARVGFDWKNAADVIAKIEEETEEVREEIAREDSARLAEEIGDLLFACANLARKYAIDPETALHGANRRFESRFRQLEDRLRAQDREPSSVPLEELEALWQAVKRDRAKESNPA
jgi:ATP diphosphatase